MKTPANYIETVYGTRTFARALDLNDADSIMDLMQDFSDYNNKQSDLPQTDFTRKIEVTAYDAKMFIGRIQSQIEILEMVNKKDEAKHWQELSRQAHLLFGIAYNGTDREVQLYIESEYNKSLNK